jgi:hypothetical protein
MATTSLYKAKEECQHGINKSDDKSYHFTLNLQAIDFSSGVEFNEEEIFQASKEEGNLQQEVPWVVYFIFEDNEIVGEQQKTTLQFSTNVQQQFIFATSPWQTWSLYDGRISSETWPMKQHSQSWMGVIR